jgi:hypothetical protein
MMSAKIVQQLVVVYGKGRKNMWVPDQKCVTVDDVERTFVQVDRWCSPLIKFCSGSHGRQNQALHSVFLDEMQRLRTEASNTALAETLCRAHEAGEGGKDVDQKKKIRKKAKSQDEMIAPSAVEIVMNVDGADVKVLVLWGIKNNPVWMELTVQNLDMLKNGITASTASPNKKIGRIEASDVGDEGSAGQDADDCNGEAGDAAEDAAGDAVGEDDEHEFAHQAESDNATVASVPFCNE